MDEDTKNRRGKTREGGDVEISPRQQATLDAIREYWARHRIGPSRADLAAALGLKSQSGTDRHIQTLLRRGLVESVPGASRSLRAVESGDVPLIEAKGRVSHRKALAEDVHRIGWIPDCLAARFSPRPDYFLVITDEKLCRLGVATGDPVAVRDARRATTRDVVVARVNGAVCWGQYTRVDRHTVELVPPGRNRRAEALRIDLLDDEFEIEGMVIGTLAMRQIASKG